VAIAIGSAIAAVVVAIRMPMFWSF